MVLCAHANNIYFYILYTVTTSKYKIHECNANVFVYVGIFFFLFVPYWHDQWHMILSHSFGLLHIVGWSGKLCYFNCLLLACWFNGIFFYAIVWVFRVVHVSITFYWTNLINLTLIWVCFFHITTNIYINTNNFYV